MLKQGMPAIAVLAAAAAAWCFLQVDSRHLDALAGGAALNNANFLDNDQWLSTVSQYDRDKYWNRFREVSTPYFSPWISQNPFSVSRGLAGS
uniref:Testican-1 n=1 Tax=Mus spicilegus TaxID=10103 RepID=A0A8C6HP45_MUSSI